MSLEKRKLTWHGHGLLPPVPPIISATGVSEWFQNNRFSMTWTWWTRTPPPCPPRSSEPPLIPCFALHPILALHFAASTLHCVPLCIFTATSTLYNSTLHLPPCVAAPNCVLSVPPCMWPLSRPNPISHWTGHRGLYPETQCSLRTQNTARSCTCVSHSAIIVEHITIVAFHSCRNTMLVNQLSC